MVSTRGVKAKFSEGEKVLCYEPDPTKAKVLYESKVLQVVQNKDGRSKKIEYLIHFQGWNASWDRCVDEDLVLRDTEENRQLQRTLMENAQIKLKEKKKKRRLSDTIREIVLEKEKTRKCGSESGSQIGNTDEDDDDGRTSSPSDQESLCSAATSSLGGGRRESVVDSAAPSVLQEDMTRVHHAPNNEDAFTKEFPIDIPSTLKAVLERDFTFIKEKGMLLKLPSTPSALTVLESHVVFFSSRYLARTSERRRTETKLKDKAYLTLDLCKEVMDGLRVCFDFHCKSHFLYAEEQKQAAALMTAQLPPHLLQSDSVLQGNGLVSPLLSGSRDEGNSDDGTGNRRLTRSGGRMSQGNGCGQTSDSGRSTPVTGSSSQCSVGGGALLHRSNASVPSVVDVSSWHMIGAAGHHHSIPQDLSNWSLLPITHRGPGIPTLMYGPLHLLRMCVKLPEILFRMNLPAEKKKIVVKHIQLFIEYLDVHSQDFFSESHYTSNIDV